MASLGTKMMDLAFGALNKVAAPFVAEPLFATSAMRRRDWGATGSGGESLIGVVLPAELTDVLNSAPSTQPIDLGAASNGGSVEVTVYAQDAANAPVMLNEITFTTEAGDTFEDSDDPITIPTFGVSGSPSTAGEGAVTGQWVVNGGGVHTLTASCFGCASPPLTGDNTDDDPVPPPPVDPDDPRLVSDDLAFFEADGTTPQTIEFTVTVLELSILPILTRPKPVVDVSFPVTVCIGAQVGGVGIEFTAERNNGQPTDILIGGVTTPLPHVVITGSTPTDPFYPDASGCITVDATITKEGGIRIIATLVDTGEFVESNKVNISPK
jgi:hypothetical protein